jgi:hypothetical protein
MNAIEVISNMAVTPTILDPDLGSEANDVLLLKDVLIRWTAIELLRQTKRRKGAIE